MSKVVIVTGGSAGLGRAMSLALLGAGHRVAAVGRSTATMDELIALATAAGSAERLLPVFGDVTVPADAEAIVATTVAHFGKLDGLINNAGINLPTHTRKDAPKFWQVNVDDWRRLMDVNVNGPFQMARAAAPHLIANGWGRIVNHVTSLRTMIRGGDTPYGPSKAALEAMATAWSEEFAGTGVNVHAILPGGAADTRMIDPTIIPDRSKLVQPSAMAAPILWVMSEASDKYTGLRIIAAEWKPEADDLENITKACAEAGWKAALSTTTARPWPPV